MRIAVLILAVLAAVASGALGFKWYSDYNALGGAATLKEFEDGLARSKASGAPAADLAMMEKNVAELKSTIWSAYLLMLALPVGIVAGVLAYMGRGIIAGPILLLMGVLPCVFQVRALLTGVLLLLAGGLAFLCKQPAREPLSEPAPVRKAASRV
jgi:hypothetical protein